MSNRIAIVGGGIGGLTAALLLLQRGFDVQIYERAPQLLELGAGLQLGPNAVRVIQSIGLTDKLAKIACRPQRTDFFRWKDGSCIASRPSGDAEAMYGAPHYTVHRGELLSLLLQAIPAERIHVSHECVQVTPERDEIRLSFANGHEAIADFLVGADGIHSVVRAAIVDPDKPEFSGFCAYRGIIPLERFQQLGEVADHVAVWFGPGAHLVQYPISSGSLINFVGVVTEPSWTRESWYDSASKDEYLAFFDQWHPRLQAIMREVDESKLMKWALYDRKPLPYWSKGRVTLLGDAAHAMLTFLGQGAAQAIEDGAILARCLSALPAETALTTYERVRFPRATQIQEMSRANGVFYHLEDGDAQRRRDARIKAAQAIKDPVYAYDALTAELEAPDRVPA